MDGDVESVLTRKEMAVKSALDRRLRNLDDQQANCMAGQKMLLQWTHRKHELIRCIFSLKFNPHVRGLSWME